jgi:5-methylcytosine-specific restriction endonuclease McrA
MSPTPEWSRAYYLAHRDQIRANQKRYAAKNKEAFKERARLRYLKNKEHINAHKKAYNATHKKQRQEYWAKVRTNPIKRIRYLLYIAKCRARRAGIEFEPALVDLLLVDIPTACPCCGVVFDFSTNKRKRGINVNASPSLDRFNSTQGYIVKNVMIICMRCNRIKCDATLAEIEAVCNYMRRCGVAKAA